MLRQRHLPVKGPPPVAAGPSSYDSAGWAAAGEEISDDNLLWRQYILFVDLYRYYIDLEGYSGHPVEMQANYR
jgi:hypothetical protein